MFRVTREIDFCYGHRLLGYEGKCQHLHGHNGRVLITFESSQLDELGMVLDFSEIKQTVSRWIDAHLDHRMLLEQNDPMVPVLRSQGEPVLVMSANPTAENIARLISQVATDEGYPVVEVSLWETPRCFATHRPGLDAEPRIEWELSGGR
jgi:6-pyruvoyltetrahydropterin/6-carboxytetrahydropterin synthase